VPTALCSWDTKITIIIIILAITETGGNWNHWAVEFVREIGRWATIIIGEPRESNLSISAVVNSPPKGNVVGFLNTFDSIWTPLQS